MFTKENTKQIKGVAILLMLAHHLFTFPERIPYNLEVASNYYISGQELTYVLGSFGKICVALFMFLGGLGLFISSVNSEENSIKVNALTIHIIKLYRAYWKVFLVFIPLGFLIFHNQFQYCEKESLCFKFSDFNFSEFFSNFIGWSSSYNGEWWFFKTYIFTLFEGFIFLELFKKKNNVYLEFGMVILWHILISQIFPIISSLPGWESLANDAWYSELFTIHDYSILFFVGIIFGKYHIFDHWNQILNKYNLIERILISTFFIISCIYVRVFVLPVSFDMFIVPLFIIGCLTIIKELKFLSKFLELLGNNSTNMWLIHSFYCYYFYPFTQLVYKSKNAFISFLTLLSLSFISSLILDKGWLLYFKIYHSVRNKLVSIQK